MEGLTVMVCRAARSREVKEKQAAAQAKRKENIQKYRGKNARKSLMGAEKKPSEGDMGGDRTGAGGRGVASRF